jgi:subtilisin family serine protease
MLRHCLAAALAVVCVVATAHAQPAHAERGATLRVMLNPAAAARGTLPDAARRRLEALAGMPLTLAGASRTGALELTLARAQDAAQTKDLIKRLREDRMVLWAEVSRPEAARLARAKALFGPPGRKLMVRLADPARSIDDALPALAARAGVALRVERRVGDVHVLSLDDDVPAATLTRIAEALQADGAVQYADPVRRAHIMRVPNDPMFAEQWSLTDMVAGIDATTAWNYTIGDPSITVAVVDTGILPHPDLAGRVLSGYDFISDARRAGDGSGRDSDPRDEGDWRDVGDCGLPFSEPSSWHGTFVAGLIGANGDNGIGIAGVDWGAKILPVRVLGRCGGTFDDILAGVMWAAGRPIAGAPANPTPAKVINLSLGGEGPCDQAIQEGIDDALAQGTIVVVAAGNSSADATGFAPASCSGVITVGAASRAGERTSYTNFGYRVDLSAPGGDFPSDDLLMVSTSNDGTTTPGAPSYKHEAGTSFSSPLVAGTVSLMLARNALLTPGQALSILQNTTRNYPPGSSCGAGACGAGILDAGLAVSSTVPGGAQPPANATTVVEFYREDLDHYFITASAAEAALVDALFGNLFKRTGFYFYAYADPLSAPFGARPVCRFYAAGLINSHYYTADPAECQYVQTHWAGIWNLETPAAFYVSVPDSAGNCPAGTLPVYRFFNGRRDANHRYTVDLSIRRAMINRGWVQEGAGPNGVVFCSPV